MMNLSIEQIKGRIKNIAKENNADAIVLLRIFMMERFLERLSLSNYKNNFIIKGGLLISSLVGVSNRTTMDIDVSIKNFDLTKERVKIIINEICNNKIDLIEFSITSINNIMNDADYSGFRISLIGKLEKANIPLSIDVSTGDVITPKEIDYEYKLMLEDRKINLNVYNIETILSEKLQTIISRGVLNTRLRDYYDIYILLIKYKDTINIGNFNKSFELTCKTRNTVYDKDYLFDVLKQIRDDNNMSDLWDKYQNKYIYAKNIEFTDCIESISRLISLI